MEKRIVELEQQMMQYDDVKNATNDVVNGKLKDLQRFIGQLFMSEDEEFTESDIDKYVFGRGEVLRRPF